MKKLFTRILVLWLAGLLAFPMQATIKDNTYWKYQQLITETIRADISNTKKIKNPVEDIISNGDIYQCYWLGTTFSRVDAASLNESAISVYRQWSRNLTIQLVAMEPALAALSDGRTPMYLDDPYFYSLYIPSARLGEMFSLLNDICNLLSIKEDAKTNPVLDSVFVEYMRVKSHYIEQTIYGSDRYATKTYGPAMSTADLQKIVSAIGSDMFIKDPSLFLSLLIQVPEWRQQNLLNVEEQILTYSEYYLSSLDMNMCCSALTQLSYAHGKSKEDSEIRMAVISRLFPSLQKMAQGFMATSHADNSEHVKIIADFLQYQQKLQEEGKEFVNYSPALCPIELQNDSLFPIYSEMYARTGYALCREIGKFNSVNYINNNGNSLRNILPIMGYGDIREEWVDRLALYLSNLAGTTLDIYYRNNASWTIGALITEAKILTEILNICSIDAVYYVLMQMIPFFAGELGDEAYARHIMETYLFPFMPHVKLQTRDKDLNCFYMDFYAKIIQFLPLYDEPRQAELKKIYVTPFEQAVKTNTYCDWRSDHLATMADYYFQQRDTTMTNKYLDEYFALTSDTIFFYTYKYLIYGGITKNYEKAAQIVDYLNRNDTAMAAKYLEYSGLNPAYSYAMVGQKAKAIQQLHVFNTYLRQQFSVQLLTVGGSQASELLKRYEKVNDFFVQAHEEIEDTTIVAGFMSEFYNWQLFSKGLLLALNKESEMILKNHPSKIVRSLYEQLTASETKLSTMTNRDSFEAQMLQSNIDEIRNNLLHTIRDYIDKNAAANIRMINWQDVRDALKEDETAIEIVCGTLENDSVNTYYALLLHQGDEAPMAIRLFKEPELTPYIGMQDTTSINSMYKYSKNGKHLSQLIWSKILPYLHEGEQIYFSPTSALHQISMESLPYDEQRTMSDVYNMVRVSSTREIARPKPQIPHRNATLYGGIIYDATPDELYAESSRYPQLALRSMDADTIDRGAVKYLPGTKKEIEQIKQTLTEQQIHVDTYSSIAANEESFKALSGSNQNILHLATHGFYWPYESLQGQKNINRYSAQYLNDPLNRCGLLFAGANTALSGHSERLDKSVHDGILTAREISLLDFSQADIVVLSACETGLGDVTSEGVFGLQRAFKMAGAQTLLMALWKVNDDATRLLMAAFYRNLNQGMSKREAFRRAQQEVRNYTAEGTVSENNGRSILHEKYKNKGKQTGQASQPTKGGAESSEVSKQGTEVSKQAAEVSKQGVEVSHPYASPYYWAGFILLD